MWLILSHFVKNITNIEGPGWQLRGNIAGLDFELYDADDKIVAVFGQKILSMHDKYCIGIYKPEYQDAIAAILITLQHIVRDREAASSISLHGPSSTGE